MEKKEYSGIPIDPDALKKADEKKKQHQKTRNKNELIAKYGASGIVKNNISEEFQSADLIKRLEKTLAEIKKYGNAEMYSFIPAEVAKDFKESELYLEYLGNKKNTDISNATGEYLAFPKDTIYCKKCGGFKKSYLFYQSMEKTENGYLCICKDCLKKMAEDFYEKYKNLEHTLLLMCLYTNCIYNQEIANLAIKNLQIKEDNPNTVYTYYRIELNHKMDSPRYVPEENTFEYSNFEGNIFKFVDVNEKTPTAYFENQNVDAVEIKKKKMTSMINKWGSGFSPEEYERMENLFEELSKFKSKKNIIQTNALIEYVRLKVKLDGAIGKGDLKEIEKWQKLTDSAAKNAGIKLDQLTAEDFGEGIDSWTALVELIEEYDSVIPIMPKIKKMPYDDIDFIIWQVVNYCRRLMEMPEVDYEDLWKYIDERFITEMKRRGYTDKEIEKERQERNAVFKELGDNYIEPLWLNPNLEQSEEDEDE